MIRIFKYGIGVPIALIILLSLMILPIPALLLDLFFTFNIALSMLVLLASIYCMRPLDFAAFPTVLLLSTLMRLALNIASTRVVLLNGHMGSHAAGKVIQSFGEVVIGGNYTVGLVIFAILIIINFVVITKGAGRISEVSARFTLDSLPGKQMAIDADMSSGIIDQQEAKNRRADLSKEADFYGSMDGASKFVRGDAIAGILILFINLLGGIIIGMMQHDLELARAAQYYALLTIGDGLVAQIPALILSTAAAMMVTRVSSAEDIGKQVISQVIQSPRPMLVAGGIMLILGAIPGMPHLAFIFMGSILVVGGQQLMRNLKNAAQDKAVIAKVDDKNKSALQSGLSNKVEEDHAEITWDDVASIDLISLEIGYRLIPLVDTKQSVDLLNKIKGIRKKLSRELGFLVPSIHIKDSLSLSPNAYRISILGVTVAQDTVYLDKDLAINSNKVLGKLNGIVAKDPSFGLDAVWISSAEQQNAQTLGYTVVDSATVIATHLSTVINRYAYQLLGHEEVQKMLELLAKDFPTLVEDLTPKTVSLTVLVKILQNLLLEGVPIRDMRTIAEILADVGTKLQDPGALTAAVRVGLGSLIIQKINGFSSEISVMTLDTELEQILHSSIQASKENSIVMEPGLAEKLQNSLQQCVEYQDTEELPLILLVAANIRTLMAKFVRNIIPDMSVLSFDEIPSDRRIKIVGTIGST